MDNLIEQSMCCIKISLIMKTVTCSWKNSSLGVCWFLSSKGTGKIMERHPPTSALLCYLTILTLRNVLNKDYAASQKNIIKILFLKYAVSIKILQNCGKVKDIILFF